MSKYDSTHVVIPDENRTVEALKQQVDNLFVVLCCVVQTQKHVVKTPHSLDLSTLRAKVNEENRTLKAQGQILIGLPQNLNTDWLLQNEAFLQGDEEGGVTKLFFLL